jgi:hypothetical protein
MDYSGKIIRKTPVVPSQTSASGVWTLDEAMQATKSNTWPVANVPDPISRSLRFRNAAGAYLNRTPATAGNRRTWTWSAWVKRGFTGDSQFLFSCWTANNDAGEFDIYINPTGNLIVQQWTSSFRVTNAIYRDPSAWYHIVVAIDTTQATAGNRVKVYVNGSEVTSFSTTNNPTLNQELAVNQVGAHYISSYKGSIYYLEGYMAETYFIDGQALTPSSFGGTNAVTGVWEPRPYTGTYGTNGFLLTFSDNTSTTTLGNDTSGNSNNWTTNNISLTAGATYDSMLDVPTQWIGFGNGTDATRGNYATFNPLMNFTGAFSATPTLSQANLLASGVADTKQYYADSTIQVSSGKWYAEFTPSTVTGDSSYVGIVTSSYLALYAPTGNYYNNSSWSAYGATYTTGDVIGVAYDADAGTITFYKNGASQGQKTGITGTNALFRTSSYNTGASHSWTANFGQRPFSYTPPAGFLSLCTTNLPSPTILQGDDYFNATLYTGTGATQTITNAGGVQPDLVWVKVRSTTGTHILTDSVRGANNQLFSNLTNAQATATNKITGFTSTGFTLGADDGSGTGDANFNGSTYVGWQWNAGGATVTNTTGSISAQVRASTTSGFSIVTYTGTGANATVGHGLGIAPSMIIVKRRDASANWPVYHRNAGSDAVGFLNTTAAFSSPENTYWNATGPTTSVFSIGTNAAVNASGGTYVAYVFAPVEGYCSIGRYTGNGSTDGPFVYTGFRPRYIMIRYRDNADSWAIKDTARNTFNVDNSVLKADESTAEGTSTAWFIDELSNGFKIRNSGSSFNTNSGAYIYIAFAENPFKNALAR